jgi:protocatechuate 3,4-dioxygenase beta subunit
MRLLFVIPLLAAYLHAQSSSVAGVVADQSGKPMAGVHVRLVTGDFGSDEGARAICGVTSDSAGQFRVEGIKPGLYIVMAERAGYVQPPGLSPMGLPFLTLKPDQHLTDYKVVLTARALIAGRVVDEFGDPVQGANVQAEPVKPGQGGMFGGNNSDTDDRGEFRIITAPGKYYLRAGLDQMDGPDGPPEIRSDGTSGASFADTYYPSAADNSGASAVEVSAGQDVAGIEIRMLRTTVSAPRGYTIGGIVTGLPENETANVMLRFAEKPGEFHNSNGTGTAPDGKFSFEGMQPGYYSVSASYTTGKTPLHSHAVDFHLDSEDHAGLQLTLAPEEELSGTLAMVGDGPAEKHTVRLQPAGWGDFGDAGSPAAEVEPDGSFHLHGVPPARFKAVVEPMPENGYLKEVAVDGKPVPDGVLDFAQGVGETRLKLTVSRAGAEISGRVLDKDGDPALGLVMVFFGTDPQHMEDENAKRVSDGNFSFKGVRPGKYRLYAIDVAGMMQVITGDGDNGDMTAKFFEAADEIEIKEGDRISKDIPAQTKLPGKKEAQ